MLQQYFVYIKVVKLVDIQSELEAEILPVAAADYIFVEFALIEY